MFFFRYYIKLCLLGRFCFVNVLYRMYTALFPRTCSDAFEHHSDASAAAESGVLQIDLDGSSRDLAATFVECQGATTVVGNNVPEGTEIRSPQDSHLNSSKFYPVSYRFVRLQQL